MRFNLAYFGLCLLALMITVQAQNTYVPYELGGDNYYTMYGGPELSASIGGTDEFERGDTVTLHVSLTNFGRVLGFKEDRTPQNDMEYALAGAELQEEYKKTTALGILATMISENKEIEVKSGDQVVESLKSGEKAMDPLKFTIKIAEHAPAGVYPLALNISYDYQDNVRVDASMLTTSGKVPTLSNFVTSFIYRKSSQTLPLFITVKKQADFEIKKASGKLSQGSKKEPMEVTYENSGEDAIKDAVVRLSIFKPFSSTDDQAFIGSLDPGENKTVVFRMDVDSDATPKEYGINSEIKYTDVNGDTVISESMKIPVEVNPAGTSLLWPAITVLTIIIGSGVYVHKRKKKST